MRDVLTAHGDRHTADGAHTCARLGVVSDHMARQGRRYDTYATAAGVLQGLQALSPRHWPPLGAFIKLPALRVVHDLRVVSDIGQFACKGLMLRLNRIAWRLAMTFIRRQRVGPPLPSKTAPLARI